MSTVAELNAAAPSTAGIAHQSCGPYARARRPGGRMDMRGTEAHLAWWCKKDEADDALSVIGGVSQSVSIFGNAVLRVVPLQHPDYSWLYASEVTWEDYGEDGAGNFTRTLIEVKFTTPNYATDGDMPYVEFSGNPSSRSIPTPASAWSVAAAAPHRDPDYDAGGADFELVLHNCPAVDLATLLTYSRYVNSLPFLGCDAGTILYHGPRWHQQVRLGNQQSWQIALAFTATSPEAPWNYFSAADGSLGVLTRSGGAFRYPEVDFNQLFA